MTDRQIEVLTLQDLIVLKQFIEKGFREKFFNSQEMNYMTALREKISDNIQKILSTK